MIVRGQGIATRRFSFELANGAEVRMAELQNGLLAIELERPPKDARVQTVGIVSGGKTAMTHRALGSKRATVSDSEYIG